jgi:capsular polysaccharide biosynthesis protein
MELISILRVLRRHRVLVAIGVALVVLVAMLVTYQVSFIPPKLGSRVQTSGTATARVIIAARTQPAFDLESHITDTLGTRAALLANFLSADDVRANIAGGAGLKPDEVAVMSPVWGAPALALPLPIKATEAAAIAHEPYVLTVSSRGDIPIISLKATGPDAVRAAKVTNAAIAAISDLIAAKSTGRPDIVVERLGPAIARTSVTGPRKAVALAGAFVVLGIWCAGVVVLEWFIRRRRTRRRQGAAAPQYSPST